MGNKLADAIRDARETRGWTTEDLAQRAGVTRSTISKIELGQQQGSVQVVMRIAKALDIDLTSISKEWADPDGPTESYDDTPREVA